MLVLFSSGIQLEVVLKLSEILMVRVGIRLIRSTCRVVDTIDYGLHVVPTIALNALMMGCRSIASSRKR